MYMYHEIKQYNVIIKMKFVPKNQIKSLKLSVGKNHPSIEVGKHSSIQVAITNKHALIFGVHTLCTTKLYIITIK